MRPLFFGFPTHHGNSRRIDSRRAGGANTTMAMLSRLLICAISISFALLLPTSAGEVKAAPRAVLELFTSQGCSSCPKADALLEEMGKRDDVVALAYHVDYWDYIGWEDTFGSKVYSQLQREYAKSWGSSRIFTPQLVVNGKGGVVGSKREAVNAQLGGAALPLVVDLHEGEDDTLEVSVAGHTGHRKSTIWLVTFLDRADVAIERGENKGKRIAYTQIVTGRQVLGMWNPETGASLTLPMSEVLTGRTNGAAILIQEDRGGLPGPILGAATFTR